MVFPRMRRLLVTLGLAGAATLGGVIGFAGHASAASSSPTPSTSTSPSSGSGSGSGGSGTHHCPNMGGGSSSGTANATMYLR